MPPRRGIGATCKLRLSGASRATGARRVNARQAATLRATANAAKGPSTAWCTIASFGNCTRAKARIIPAGHFIHAQSEALSRRPGELAAYETRINLKRSCEACGFGTPAGKRCQCIEQRHRTRYEPRFDTEARRDHAHELGRRDVFTVRDEVCPIVGLPRVKACDDRRGEILDAYQAAPVMDAGERQRR